MSIVYTLSGWDSCVGGTGNSFASEGDPPEWWCSADAQTLASEHKTDCFTSISLITSPGPLRACSVLCSVIDLVVTKAHNVRTLWVRLKLTMYFMDIYYCFIHCPLIPICWCYYNIFESHIAILPSIIGLFLKHSYSVSWPTRPPNHLKNVIV